MNYKLEFIPEKGNLLDKNKFPPLDAGELKHLIRIGELTAEDEEERIKDKEPLKDNEDNAAMQELETLRNTEEEQKPIEDKQAEKTKKQENKAQGKPKATKAKKKEEKKVEVDEERYFIRESTARQPSDKVYIKKDHRSNRKGR